MNINHSIQRVSEIMGVPKEKILSGSKKPEVTRCRALIVELFPEKGVSELARSLQIDHSSVCNFRKGNRFDKWDIKSLLSLIQTKVKMVSDCIDFTYPGNYNYLIIK